MKITAFNYITGNFQEKSIVPENLSKCLIGRNPNCDFILNSPEVSRVHGIIIYQQNQYYKSLHKRLKRFAPYKSR